MSKNSSAHLAEPSRPTDGIEPAQLNLVLWGKKTRIRIQKSHTSCELKSVCVCSGTVIYRLHSKSGLYRLGQAPWLHVHHWSTSVWLRIVLVSQTHKTQMSSFWGNRTISVKYFNNHKVSCCYKASDCSHHQTHAEVWWSHCAVWNLSSFLMWIWLESPVEQRDASLRLAPETLSQPPEPPRYVSRSSRQALAAGFPSVKPSTWASQALLPHQDEERTVTSSFIASPPDSHHLRWGFVIYFFAWLRLLAFLLSG